MSLSSRHPRRATEGLLSAEYHLIVVCFAVVTSFLGVGCKHSGSKAVLQDASDATSGVSSASYACGEPLAKIADANLAPGSSTLPETLAFEAISNANLERLKQSVGAMSDVEVALFDQAKALPPGNTHRDSLNGLKSILSDGAILSAAEAARKGVAPAVTPRLEDKLYGAFSCVFTAVGPINGRDRYGPVVFYLKANAETPHFGTYASGFVFMRDRLINTCIDECQCELSGKTCASGAPNMSFHYEAVTSVSNCNPSCNKQVLAAIGHYEPDDATRLSYAQTVIAEHDWPDWFAYTLIQFLRAKPNRAEIESHLESIAAEPDGSQKRRDWWSYVDDQWLGYLEGKYAGSLPLSAIDHIEVPSNVYQTVMSWDVPEEAKALVVPVPVNK